MEAQSEDACSSGVDQAATGAPVDLRLRWVLLLFAVCYAPFLGKAFHIDDPLFLWVAKHLQQRPLDFYCFPVNWYGTVMPMSAVTKNPPLSSYFAALWAWPFGFGELSMHLAFLLPALGALAGTYALARDLCRRPGEAALVTAAMPAFFVSSTSVMCDVTMLCGWVWSVLLWHRALRTRRPALFAAAVVLVAVAALTKYFGAALIPLLALYALLVDRRVGAWAGWLLIPVAALAGYQAWTHHLYGAGLLSDAASYATMVNRASGTAGLHLVVALAFMGGCMLPVLLYAGRLWHAKVVAVGALAFVVLTLLGTVTGALVRIYPLLANRWVVAQASLMLVGGLSVLLLVVRELQRDRGAETILLSIWVLGTLVFASLLNWTVNARSLLPMAPALAILMMRRLEARPGGGDRVARFAPLGASAVLALLVAGADARQAATAKEAALRLGAQAQETHQRVWFSGHWGFQYYAQLEGLRAVDEDRLDLIRRGDVIVVPYNGTGARNVVRASAPPTRAMLELEPFPGVTTLEPTVGAGFYTDAWGPLPFAFGDVPPDRYTVILLNG